MLTLLSVYGLFFMIFLFCFCFVVIVVVVVVCFINFSTNCDEILCHVEPSFVAASKHCLLFKVIIKLCTYMRLKHIIRLFNYTHPQSWDVAICGHQIVAYAKFLPVF